MSAPSAKRSLLRELDSGWPESFFLVCFDLSVLNELIPMYLTGS